MWLAPAFLSATLEAHLLERICGFFGHTLLLLLLLTCWVFLLEGAWPLPVVTEVRAVSASY